MQLVRSLLSALILLFLLLIGTPSRADIVTTLDAKIRSHPTVLSRLKDGDAIVSARIVDVSIRPTYQATALRITGNPTEVPLRIDSEEFLAKNCTAQERSRLQKLGITSQLETTITVTAAADVKEDVKTSFNASAGTDLPVSVGRESTKSKSFSLSTVRTERVYTDDRDEWEENRVVPAHTAILIRGQRKVLRQRWPFEGSVTLNGEVIVYRDILLQGNHVVRNNPMQFDLAELFPNPAERTTVATGYVDAGVATKSTVAYGEMKLNPADRKQCSENFISLSPQESAAYAQAVQYLSVGVNAPPLAALTTKISVDGAMKTAQIPTRQFFARGKHTCQSKSSLGHQCTASGVGFFDCTNAYSKLKQQDCCRNTKSGGTSIGFKIEKCTGTYPS